MKRHADHLLDFRGSITTISLLKLIQTFAEMKPNEILEILGNNIDTRSDLFKFLPKDSYELIFWDVVGEVNPFCQIQLKKKKTG